VTGDLLDDPPGDRRRQQRLPLGHDPDGGEEVLWGGRLQQEPAGTDLQGLEHVVALEGGEDQHPGLVAALAEDPPGGLQAVQPRHLDIHQHHGRAVPADRVDSLLAVLGLGHDLDAGLGLQNQPEAPADQRLVVGQDYGDRRDPRSEHRVDRKPPPGRPTASRRPPYRHPALACADQPFPSGLLPSGGGLAVVDHLDLDAPVSARTDWRPVQDRRA
jgi:hypothetical protein